MIPLKSTFSSSNVFYTYFNSEFIFRVAGKSSQRFWTYSVFPYIFQIWQLLFSFLDLCQNVHCMHGARCERGRCVCQFDCPDDYDPVCGSDGSTYRNDCEMRRGACTKAIHLSTVFYGECDRTLSAREGRHISLWDKFWSLPPQNSLGSN